MGTLQDGGRAKANTELTALTTLQDNENLAPGDPGSLAIQWLAPKYLHVHSPCLTMVVLAGVFGQ